MLSKIILSVYPRLLELGLWITIAFGILAGFWEAGIVGAVFGAIFTGIGCALILGALLTLIEISETLKSIDKKLK